jgi:hypothetical protein
MTNLLDKFKKFVSDNGYELVVSDSGISIDILFESLSEDNTDEETSNIISE